MGIYIIPLAGFAVISYPKYRQLVQTADFFISTRVNGDGSVEPHGIVAPAGLFMIKIVFQPITGEQFFGINNRGNYGVRRIILSERNCGHFTH